MLIFAVFAFADTSRYYAHFHYYIVAAIVIISHERTTAADSRFHYY